MPRKEFVKWKIVVQRTFSKPEKKADSSPASRDRNDKSLVSFEKPEQSIHSSKKNKAPAGAEAC
jgi:hypothetical protein